MHINHTFKQAFNSMLNWSRSLLKENNKQFNSHSSLFVKLKRSGKIYSNIMNRETKIVDRQFIFQDNNHIQKISFNWMLLDLIKHQQTKNPLRIKMETLKHKTMQPGVLVCITWNSNNLFK